MLSTFAPSMLVGQAILVSTSYLVLPHSGSLTARRSRPPRSMVSPPLPALDDEHLRERRVNFIGAPFCEGQNLAGADLAPTAIRRAGIEHAVQKSFCPACGSP